MTKCQQKSVWLFVHNVLLLGSPGAGKTLLARTMPGILPEMSIEESLDVIRIYSVADQLSAGTPLMEQKEFVQLCTSLSLGLLWGLPKAI
jgi:predicted ATPase with chaperone activity